MLSITRTQCLSSCPASCVVCSDDAVICHKLSNFIEAPETTKALMLTDGAIVSVDRHFLSDMSNMTVLSLSHNAITTLTHDAFQNLTILHTLLLDHNHLSSQTLDRATFSWLPRLEILQLGNNALREVKGSWFHAARALRTLQLGGNSLTRLDATTFASADLRALETLDLSDNLITYLGRDSFRGLPGLRSLDLSRNQLRNTLPEAFSYLSWLTSLNLELNRWNCTCELRELASFLTSYMEAPDKVLFNGRRMVCVSADNPAVKMVLELTEANCVPPNQNITVQVEAKNSVSPQRYTRDLALAAAFCFAGQYLFHQWPHVTFLFFNNWTGAKEEENRRTAPTQTVPQWDPIRENQALHLAQMGLETKLMLPNSNQQGSHLQPWERERAMYDLKMGKDGRHFTRPHCGPAVTGSAVEQGGGDEHMNTLDMLRQGGVHPNKMGSLAMTDERRRHALISKMEGKHVLVNIFPDCVASTWGCVKHTLQHEVSPPVPPNG
uniref:LRRCT domain-containing protein n=1 Tax=Oncorhynchus kisutch TaxID=8019 RepID=A0A8C7MQB8_ONCKI